MSNKHLPSACSKKPFSSSDIRAAEVLTWICPCISCELLHRPHRTQTSKHVCWGRIRMFDLGDVTKKMYLYHIYIYTYTYKYILRIRYIFKYYPTLFQFMGFNDVFNIMFGGIRDDRITDPTQSKSPLSTMKSL